MPADDPSCQRNTQLNQEAPMALFASDYDKSKYLRAEDLKQEKKFRIKAVTEEMFEKDGKTRRRSSSSGSPTMSAGWC